MGHGLVERVTVLSLLLGVHQFLVPLRTDEQGDALSVPLEEHRLGASSVDRGGQVVPCGGDGESTHEANEQDALKSYETPSGAGLSQATTLAVSKTLNGIGDRSRHVKAIGFSARLPLVATSSPSVLITK